MFSRGHSAELNFYSSIAQKREKQGEDDLQDAPYSEGSHVPTRANNFPAILALDSMEIRR